MVDLKQFEKVYEWDAFRTTFARLISDGPVVYAISIGEDLYIEGAIDVYLALSYHLKMLLVKSHPNHLMQEAFNKQKLFSVYLLEQMSLFENYDRALVRHIGKMKPSLNKGWNKASIDRSKWSNEDCSLCAQVCFDDDIKSQLNQIQNEQGIAIQEIIKTSVVNFLRRYQYYKSPLLSEEGIMAVQVSMVKETMESLFKNNP